MLSEEGGTGHDDVASLQKLNKKEIICAFGKKMGLGLMLCPDSRS